MSSVSRKRRLRLATACLVWPSHAGNAFLIGHEKATIHHASPGVVVGGIARNTAPGTSVALGMVASRPRIDEEIIINGGGGGAYSRIKTANRKSARKKGSSYSSLDTAKGKNSRSRRRNQKHPHKKAKKGGSRLPLLDEDDAAYEIHQSMSESIRQFDEIRRHLTAKGKEQTDAVARGMQILVEAQHVLDGYLTPSNGDEEDIEDGENELNEWIVYYATKVIRCYLHLERQCTDPTAPSAAVGAVLVSEADSNDPLLQADHVLQRLEQHFGPSYSTNNGSRGKDVNLLPWMDTRASLVPAHYLREQIYNALIGAYTKRFKFLCSSKESNSSTTAGQQQLIAATAESILERMVHSQSSLVKPDAKTYGLVLSAYARCGCAASASKLLGRMEGRYDDSDNDPHHHRGTPPKPGVICYNAVLNAYARSGMPHDAMELLHILVERGVKADVVSYTSVLDGWARWLQPAADGNGNNNAAAVMQAVSHSEDIMTKLENSSDGPNVVAYNALLKVYLNGAKMLGRINTTSTSTSSVNFVNNTESSSSALLQLAEMALSVSDRMSKAKVYPNRITYSCAIHTCTATADSIAAMRQHQQSSEWQSQARNAAELSYRILMTMERSFVSSGDSRLAPPVKLYNMVITALGRCQLEECILKAEKLIHHMEEHDHLGIESLPNTVTYTAYMKALADMCCPMAARRAEEVLTKMERSYRNGNAAVKPTLLSYNTSLRAWAKIQNRIGAERADRALSQMEAKNSAGISNVCPDLYSYSICIDAWAKSKDRCAGERAESIFGRMKREPAFLSPNLVVYNALINAWGASEDPRAGEEAMEILSEMEQCSSVRPDRVTYSSVIDALAKCGADDAASKSEDVLRRMEERGCISPSAVTYNCVLNALATSGKGDSAPRAEAILDRMEGSDTISYNTAIKAWALSSCDDKAVRAQSILERMHENNNCPSPDLVTYNTVLNACASSNENHVEAFQIAMCTFSSLQQSQHLRPNEYTYGTLLKACATLLPPGQERVGLVEQIFQDCCDSNCLNEPVLRMLRSSMADEDYAHILGDGQATAESYIDEQM